MAMPAAPTASVSRNSRRVTISSPVRARSEDFPEPLHANTRMSGRARMGRWCFRRAGRTVELEPGCTGRLGFVGFPPFPQKKRKGWGTEAPGDRKIPEWLMEAYRFPMSQKQGHGAPMVVEIDA